MLDVVEGGESTEEGGFNMIILKFDGACCLEHSEGLIYESEKELFHGVCLVVLDTVEGWVLHEASEEVGPCDPIYALLTIGDCSRWDFSVDVIR